jgi:hypothetical protein
MCQYLSQLTFCARRQCHRETVACLQVGILEGLYTVALLLLPFPSGRCEVPQKILVIEDNQDCREIFAMLIGHLGYDVIQAASAAEGMQGPKRTPRFDSSGSGPSAHERYGTNCPAEEQPFDRRYSDNHMYGFDGQRRDTRCHPVRRRGNPDQARFKGLFSRNPATSPPPSATGSFQPASRAITSKQ